MKEKKRKKKKERKDGARAGGRGEGSRTGCSPPCPGAYRLALVLIHRGLHLPNLLPIWKSIKTTAFERTIRTHDLRQKPTNLYLYRFMYHIISVRCVCVCVLRYICIRAHICGVYGDFFSQREHVLTTENLAMIRK